MEKVFLYGMGQYAIKKVKEYCIRVDYIEAIIDNYPEEIVKYFKKGGYDIKVFTWEEFIEKGRKYAARTIVVASVMYKEEIINQILESGLFDAKQIVFLDEWVNKTFGTGPRITDLIEYPQKTDDNIVDKIIALDEEALKNAVLLSDRAKALNRFPKNMIVAEVGVAFGDFSKLICEEMMPKKFYAIDIFDETIRGFWGDEKFEETGLNHYEWYAKRFSKEITMGMMELRKGVSWEVMEKFPDDYFDYVYLDAGHDYSSVQRDVEVLKRKIKNGGIIQFNDYIIFDYSAGTYYGVVPVVNQLIADTHSEVLYYCFHRGRFDDIVVKLHK